jgi:hypothetical protein
MFVAPARLRTTKKGGFKNMLTEVSMLYTDKTTTKIPTANMINDKTLPVVRASLKISNASVPVVSLKIGSFFGI